MVKNNLLKHVLWNIVEDNAYSYFDETDEQYSSYIRELLKNDNFLIHEYFNSIKIGNDMSKRTFIDLINTYQNFNLTYFIEFLCYLNTLDLGELKSFFKVGGGRIQP